MRERAEDISLLVQHFAIHYANNVGRRIVSVERKTLDLLKSYSWPGNIRELQKVIERSVILCDSDVLSVDEGWFGEELGELEPISNSLSDQLELHERHLIEAELTRSRGRVAGQQGAAAILGVPVSTLESRIKTLKIDKSRFRAS